MSTRTRAERRDELVNALGRYDMDMPRLHRILSKWPSMADHIESVLAQVERSHGEVAQAYVAWVAGRRDLTRTDVNRITMLLAQPPLIPRCEVTR
jgi:hypothetical protein